MKSINITGILLGCILLTSCGDWLNVLPKSQMDSERMFDNPDGYYSALAGVYLKMANKGAYGKSMSVSELEIMGNTMSMLQGGMVDPYYDQGLFNGLASYFYPRENRFKNVENSLTTIWRSSYNVIANTNLMIMNLEKQDPSIFEDGAKDLILGEALAIRAYVHFDMLRLFQPPYITPEGKSQKRIPYKEDYGMGFTPSSGSDEILAKIIQDLSRAEGLMKSTDPISSGMSYSATLLKGDRKLKMNYYAVRALQSRVYLYKGDYPDAYQAAMEVIGAADAQGIRFLTEDDLKIKDSSNDLVYRSCPMENIFGLIVEDLPQYVEADRAGNSADGYSYFESFRLQSTRYPKFYSSTADIRLTAWKKKSSSNMYFAKYERPTLLKDQALYPQSVLSMLKLGEIYLIAAESAAESVSTGEALRLLTILQTVRKGGIFTTDNKEALIAEIIKEYRRELIGDGQMFYAYKRRNIPEIEKGYSTAGSTTMSVEKYTPDIPSIEFNGGRVY